MTVVGEDIKCVGIHYNRSLAVFQLFQQGSFRFLVSSQSGTDADCLIVVRVGRYGKTGFVDVGFYDASGMEVCKMSLLHIGAWTVSNPTPERRQARAARTEAPAIPFEPAINSAWSEVPLIGQTVCVA